MWGHLEERHPQEHQAHRKEFCFETNSCRLLLETSPTPQRSLGSLAPKHMQTPSPSMETDSVVVLVERATCHDSPEDVDINTVHRTKVLNNARHAHTLPCKTIMPATLSLSRAFVRFHDSAQSGPPSKGCKPLHMKHISELGCPLATCSTG